MTVNGDSTRIVEVQSYRGIQGSTAINAIPEGFCLDLENATLNQKGVIRKREGYNLWGQELPVKIRNIKVDGVTGRITTQLDSTPVITCDITTLYKNTTAILESLVPEYEVAIPLTNNVIIARITATLVEITTDTLFEALDGSFFSPVFVARAVVDDLSGSSYSALVFSISVLQKLLTAPQLAAWHAAVGAYSQVVDSANLPLIHTGVACLKKTTTFPDAITILTTTRLKITTSQTQDLNIGDTVYFESCIYYNGVGGVTDIRNNYGVIEYVTPTEVYITTEKVIVYYTVGGLPDISYFKMRYVPGMGIAIVWKRSNVTIPIEYSVKPQEYKYDFNAVAPAPTIDMTVADFWKNLTVPLGPNLVQVFWKYGIQLKAQEGIAYIYGLRIPAGYVGMLNKFFDNAVNHEVLVCGVDGNFFKEIESSYLSSVLMPPTFGTNVIVTPDPVTFLANLTMVNAYKIYRIGDIITRTILTDTKGNVTTTSMTVTNVSGNTITVYTGSASNVTITANAVLPYTRTSNRIYLTYPGTLQTSGGTLVGFFVPGQTIQINNHGKDYPYYVITRINQGLFADVLEAAYGNWIEIDNTITYDSGSSVYIGATWLPIFYGLSGVDVATNNKGMYTYAPVTSAQFAQSNKDLYSTNFDYSVYIATGVDSVWRYDGKDLSNIRLPAPPLAYWRNIPNTFGNLPVTLGNDGKTVGTPVTIKLTYIYTDNLGREYESPVSPLTDLTITTAPVEDGSDSALLVEVRVPSVPPNIGFPSEKIRIRAYREFTEPYTKVTAFRLDAEVLNVQDSEFTSLVVGKPAESFSADYEILYTEVDTLGNNRPSPMADLITVLDNKLVALGGYELPKFEVVFNQTFLSENVPQSVYASWLKIDYVSLNTPTKTLSFVNIPFSKDGLVNADYGNICPYPAFKTYKTTSATANGEFVIDTSAGKGVTYADQSNKFRLKSTGADLTTYGTRAKLRLVGSDIVAPIKFNTDVYSALLDATTAPDEIILTANTKWTLTDTAAVIGTDITQVGYFDLVTNVYGTLGVTGSANGGLSIVAEVGTNTIQMYIKNGYNPGLGAYNPLSVNDVIIIQMNKQVDGVFVEDTIGNIQRVGETVNLSFNSDLIWKVTVATVGAPFDIYTLTPVYLKADLSTQAYNILAHASVVGTNGEFEIYLLTNTAQKPVLKTSSFSVASKQVVINTTADPSSIVANDYININFFDSTGLTSPNFAAVGLPNLNGSFKVISSNAGAKTVTIEVDKLPSQVATNATQSGTAWAGSIVVFRKYVTVDLTNKQLTIKASAAVVNVIVNDWHFILFRGYEFNSVCAEFSGWFRVKDITGIAAGTVIYHYFSPVTLTTAQGAMLVSGTSLARIITYPTAGDVRYVPVPVPYKNGLAEELLDLSWPMFEQRSDAIYTPLWASARRFALAFNTVLRDVGFAYWGGAVDTNVALYPANGFSFIAHRYPINRYRYFQNGTYTRPTIHTDDYLQPWDKFIFTPQAYGYQTLFANIITNRNFIPNTYEIKNLILGSNALEMGTIATFVSTYQGSRIWWSSPVTNKEVTNRITVFKYAQTDEINSADGENIVGAVAYQNYLIVSKNNSIFRTTLSKTGDKIDMERAQSTIGATSGKNMIATESYLYFIHTSGVYFLNGLKVEPETTLNNYFNDRVIQNSQLIPFAAGYHDPVLKEVILGTPYSPDNSSTVSTVDGQFVYNYNEGVFGWSVNLNFPAVFWQRMENENYFSSIDGAVYKKRTERGLTLYRDYNDPIAFKLRTRYINMDAEVNFKFIRNFIIQLGMESNMNVTINYTWDYFKDTKALTVIPVSNAKYATSPYSAVTLVSNKYLKPVRGTVQPNRVAQLGLEVINAELDAKLELYGIYIEGQTTNTRLITQKNQTR